MSQDQSELEVLREAIPRFEADGYRVYIQPSRAFRPAFLGDYEPDAIALREDGNLVLEVARRTPASEEKLKALSELVSKNPDWTLRVVWAEPLSNRNDPSIVSHDDIVARLEEATTLAAAGHTEIALILCWAAFEATARLKMPDMYRRAQTPGRVVETLASAGRLTPSEADQIRRLIERRNRLVHGQLTVRVSKKEVDQFIKSVRALLDQA
jgi:uncharacterized protein YutE (UPF0331/DUF86 family)